MPNKVAYPGPADLALLIRSLGVFDNDDALAAALDLIDLDTLAGAASRQWEEETGWIPFLADAQDVTRRYDPQGPNWRPWIQGGGYPLDLGAGLVVLTSLTTGVTSTSTGSVLTLDSDFYLYPYNADETLRPWTALEFVTRQWGVRRSIKVVGKFGYAVTVPDDAWLAIARMGVAMALPEIATTVTEGGWTFTEAGVTEKPMDAFLLGEGTVGGTWRDEWKDAVLRYKRLVL